MRFLISTACTLSSSGIDHANRAAAAIAKMSRCLLAETSIFPVTGRSTVRFNRIRRSQNLSHCAAQTYCEDPTPLLKRCRYSLAVIPRTRRNVRRIASAVRNPHASAICLSPMFELSIICWAASTRVRSTSWLGFILASLRQTRVKCLALIPKRSASFSTVRSSRKFSIIQT